MKKEKENYERPSMEVIDVCLENVFCNSPGGTGEGMKGSDEEYD